MNKYPQFQPEIVAQADAINLDICQLFDAVFDAVDAVVTRAESPVAVPVRESNGFFCFVIPESEVAKLNQIGLN